MSNETHLNQSHSHGPSFVQNHCDPVEDPKMTPLNCDSHQECSDQEEEKLTKANSVISANNVRNGFIKSAGQQHAITVDDAASDEKSCLQLLNELSVSSDATTICLPTVCEKDSQDGFNDALSIKSAASAATIKHDYPKETFCSIGVQVFIPFLMAGFGMVGAGVVLDIVQHWPVFKDIPETIVLVPALLGLKGNLEMTLASRLSTQANLGNFDNMRSSNSPWKSLVFGNICLVQCQAITIGILASTAAILLGWIPEQDQFDWTHALILCVTSVITASLASLILGIVMVFVIITARHLKINPDNIGTPVASLGDIVTLSILAFISKFLYNIVETNMWALILILLGYILSMPIWIYVAKMNPFTKSVLYTGWTPILSAVFISSLSGLVLDYMVKVFHGIAIFQPVISGVGGNLVAVQASRISTHLHCQHRFGKLPEERTHVWSSPFTTFFSRGGHARTARALVLMVVPGHIIFSFMIRYLRTSHAITPLYLFLIFYLSAALIQVVLLLYLAEVLVHFLWSRKIDPDSSAIPYLTSGGDLLGTTLLALAFLLFQWTGKAGNMGQFGTNH